MHNLSTLEIDLNIIRENYLHLKDITSSEVAAAVKANSYGAGATEVSLELLKSGCKSFFVANLDEGINLRKHIKNADIFVLNGIFASEEAYFSEYNLIPVINSYEQALNIQNFCRAAIHIDTGMNRLGMSKIDLKNFIDNREKLRHINIEMVMSHLASSEEEDNEFNKIQLLNFTRDCKNIDSNIKKSLSNSAGIFLGNDYHFDMVRPGAALYGLNLNERMSFKNPFFLKTKIIQVKGVSAGEFVGYNQIGALKRDSIIGTIPLGYADGIFRSLSNKGYCFINNKKVNIVGRVSMDLINIDLTDLSEEDRQIGQEVEILGKNQTPSDLAAQAGTIGYEVITSIGSRYKRIYK